MALGVVFTLLVMVLVGNGVRLRARRGEPMARYAVIWALVIALLFAVTLLIGQHAGTGWDFT